MLSEQQRDDKVNLNNIRYKVPKGVFSNEKEKGEKKRGPKMHSILPIEQNKQNSLLHKKSSLPLEGNA